MLKKTFLNVSLILGILGVCKSQVVNFEDLTLPADSFWNGFDYSGGFNSAVYANFPNLFVDYGGGYTSWNGFAYSNKLNDILQDYSNQYSNYAGTQLLNSTIFAISYNSIDWNTNQVIPTEINFIAPAVLHSINVTNSAFTALTIKNGDSFSKKFGGVSGNDPDWFKLTISGYSDTVNTGNIDFYLADYRFTDSLQDYIVKNWTQIDISSLGQVTKLTFTLSSSDTGIYGMNTPAYFCFDNLYCDFITNVSMVSDNEINIFPNPTNNVIYYNKYASNVNVLDINGKIVKIQNKNTNQINVSDLENGIYFFKAEINGNTVFRKFIKN